VGYPYRVTFPVDPIQNALVEDIGSGDLTSASLVPADHHSEARIFAKEDAVLAGTETVRAVYHQLDAKTVVTVRRQDESLRIDRDVSRLPRNER
jgi:nicotinate-nucleotide pyrophosphorylase